MTAATVHEYTDRRQQKAIAVSDELSARIELSRIILIAAIVFHHIRIPSELTLYAWDNIGYVRGYIQIGLLKTAASTLTIISGYLCFLSSFEQKPMWFLRKKYTTLFFPMLLWNIPMAMLILAFQWNGQYIAKYDELTGGDIFNWSNALLGLTESPVNEPLHFLRNLIACNIIALCIAIPFRKYPLYSFLLILIVGVYNIDSYIVIRNDILIGFFLGAFLASMRIDARAIDFLLPITVPSYLVAAFVIFYFKVDFESLWWMGHRLLGFLAAWPLIGYLNKTAFRKISKYSQFSFFMFLSHYYVEIMLFHLFSRIFYINKFYIFFILSGPLTIGTCIVMQLIASRIAPSLLRISTGGRA
ncbi:acyltransferase family protein [Sinorhizobium fredii]|uniref:acyltransferase family protein n=1 Tax=Rhizobium fredii TaxID=380 RepID=UPI0005955CDD|nr:acyltransferase [Sinorhizobium fredii]WOS64794.1 acyltransferase [Sinorhizobium fredii GR64]